MPVLTSDGENYMLDAFLDKLTTDTKTLYVELTTTAPSKSSAGTAATGVSREAITLARSNDTLTNTAVDFGDASANETYVGCNIYDAASSGTRYIYGALSSNVTAVTGQPVKMLAGAFVFSPDANS